MWRKKNKWEKDWKQPSLSSLLHHGLFPHLPIHFTHTYTYRSKTEVISLSDQWAYAVALWQFQLVAWNWPPGSSYSLKTSIYNTTGCYTATIKHTTGQRRKTCKTTVLLKRNTATCRKEIYQLLLNVAFLEESNHYLLPHNQDQLHFHNFWHRTLTWIYYKTIPLEQPGLSALFKGTVVMTSHRDRTIKLYQTTIWHHQNTILQEEKPDQEHKFYLRVQRIKWSYNCSCKN